MCSINHDKKAIFIHIPKTGGTFIRENLSKYYGFNFYILKRPDHDTFCNTNLYNGNKEYPDFVANREHGILKYAKTSNFINRMINMNKEKWNDYKIFCFVRNPYDRLISGWNYLNSKHGINSSFDEFINNKERVSDFEYIHTFMSQYNNMINENNMFCIDLLGKFENIENDFKNILLNIGFKEEEIIHDLTKKNNFEHKHFTDIIINQNLLDLVNKLCYEDFDKFHYKKYDNFNIFLSEYSNKNKIVDKNKVLPTIFIKKYLQLKGQLNNYNLIDNNFYDTSIIYESLNIFIENFELIKKEFLHNINFMQDWLLKDNNHVFFNKHTILPIYGYNNWSKYANSFPIIIGLIKKWRISEIM